MAKRVAFHSLLQNCRVERDERQLPARDEDGREGGEEGRAHLAVPLDAQDLEVDVAPGRRVVGEREPERVGAALRDPAREVLLLALLGELDLLGGEVAHAQLGVQRLERRALDDVDRVDDVAERLGHLAAVRVADHGVAEDLVERDLAREVDAEEDHARDPEEEDVPARLEQARRVEVLEVGRLLGPALDREWPQARREPRVEHVVVLLERELLARELGDGPLVRLVGVAARDPEVVRLALQGGRRRVSSRSTSTSERRMRGRGRTSCSSPSILTK